MVRDTPISLLADKMQYFACAFKRDNENMHKDFVDLFNPLDFVDDCLLTSDYRIGKFAEYTEQPFFPSE